MFITATKDRFVAQRIPEADSTIETRWDTAGIPHVFAETTEDAYRGMGYACASERLWQLHLSNLYATGTASAVMGERFVTQDLMHQAFHVPAFDIPDSPGDPIVDAYLQGVNAYIANLDDVPAEFQKAGTEPRFITRHDVASRYRFTGWFQHKSWLEKIVIGRLMAEYGEQWFRGHLRRFSAEDSENLKALGDALRGIDIAVARLLFPTVQSLSGSNNWAVNAALSSSGYPMLATDPHQPHSIPNTFFYAHLNTPGWDAFGASFPGVPYFMMGFNRHVSWGLTTGFIDTYDVFVEDEPTVQSCEHSIDVVGQPARQFTVQESRHGPILESLTDALGYTQERHRASLTSLDWVMRDIPTSAGTLAMLPLAGSSAEFGEYLYENDVSPLVNNIICVDRNNDLRRFIAATIRRRKDVTGIVPIPGTPEKYYFDVSNAEELLVERNPASGYSLTANNDTMGERGDYPIHNFPSADARARRIEELLQKPSYTVDDFCRMQLDLKDLHAQKLLPDIIESMDDDREEVVQARQMLQDWDCIADLDSQAACIFYPFVDKRWHIRFMESVLGSNPIIRFMPGIAPGLSRFSIADFMQPGSPWLPHRDQMNRIICEDIIEVVTWLRQHLGEDSADWRWGDMHTISFRHSLSKHEPWQHMTAGPDEIGGSPTTLAMAMHNPPQKGSMAQEVYHGPAFRWVVDLADPLHFKFVIAGGNGGRPDSKYLTDHYKKWLHGEYFDMSLVKEEIDFAD
jgi:penicillin G amidase